MNPITNSVHYQHVLSPNADVAFLPQEFRVCMNMDPAFVAVYGTLNQTEMALCGVADPFKAQALNAGYAGHVLKDIPVMKLDTTVGGVANPTMGAASVSITNYDLSTNGNVGMLNVGDWVMVGHPIAGEPFRVRTAGPTTLGLGSIADYTVPASLTVTALQVTACLPHAFVTVVVATSPHRHRPPLSCVL
jgi:hypothetical protein